jgi:DNA-binding MarR family transcriptional regulator
MTDPSAAGVSGPEHLLEADLHGFFARLARVTLLLEELQHRCFDPFELRFIDYSVLRVLQLSGPPHALSPTRLSQLVVRSSGGMTQILDRLERRGLVARSPDPTDRRKLLVGLRPDGLRLVKRANRAWVAEKEHLLADLGPGQLQTLDAGVRLLLDRFTATFPGPSQEATSLLAVRAT